MKKNLLALCLALALTLTFGVYAQAAALLPGADELNEAQDEYILPGSDEISGTDEQGSEQTETEPAETESAPAETEPAEPTQTETAETSVTQLTNTAAAEPQNSSGELRVALNGVIINSVIPLLIGDTAYVPFRTFCVAAVAGAEISWDSDTGTSFCESDGLSIEAPFDQNYIIANGRVLYRDDANISVNNTLYVPIRSLATAIGANVVWLENELCVNLLTTGIPIAPAEQFYNQTDLLWLARIINAESKYEPLLGKIAVGNVVLNRVADPDFPGSVYDVIFDCRYTVQFYPTSSPVIYNTPIEESIIAAKACLEGYTVSGSILYFMNPRLSVSTWISRNRSFVFAIGNHSFYA